MWVSSFMCLLQSCIKVYIGSRQPILAVQEGPNGELSGLGIRKTGLVTGPSDPLVHVWSWPTILILTIKYAAGWVLPAHPFLPPNRIQESSNLRLHNHRRRKLLPWPPQISGGAETVIVGRKSAFLNRNAGVLVDVLLTLGCDGVKLVGKWLPRPDVAVLEHHRGVAEDEVDGTGDIAVSVELTVWVGVESVLIAIKWTSRHHREVGAGPEGNGLVLGWTGRVDEPHVLPNEPFASNSCKTKQN